MAFNLLLLLASLELVVCYNSDYYSNNRWFDNKQYCDDLSPYYGDVNLEQIAGVWYGVEKISHNRGEYRIEHSNECFYIDIKELYIEVSTIFLSVSITYLSTCREKPDEFFSRLKFFVHDIRDSFIVQLQYLQYKIT